MQIYYFQHFPTLKLLSYRYPENANHEKLANIQTLSKLPWTLWNRVSLMVLKPPSLRTIMRAIR